MTFTTDDDTRALIADLERELGVTGTAAVFRKALAMAKEAVAESRAASAEAEVEKLKAELEGVRKKVDCPIGIPAESRVYCSAGTCYLCLADRCVWSKEQIDLAAEASASALRDRVAVLESALRSIGKNATTACHIYRGDPDEGAKVRLACWEIIRGTARAALKESTHV